MLKFFSVFSLFLVAVFNPLDARSEADAVPEYDLTVSLDIPASRLNGEAVIVTEPGTVYSFDSTGLSIRSVTLNGRDVEHEIFRKKLVTKTKETGRLSIRYDIPLDKCDSGRAPDNAGIANCLDPKHIFLTGNWYPGTESPARYRLRINLPAGYEIVSGAGQIDRIVRNDRTEHVYHSDKPANRMSLIALSGYQVYADQFNGIDLYGYFLQEDGIAAQNYMRRIKDYFARYEKLLTAYPYKRFSFAKTALPSAFSGPGFAVSGRDAVFSEPRSSGREILEQWFGNSVYVDADAGDWAAGLIAYLSDHLHEEKAGSGSEYRRRLLLDYLVSVNPESEISLREFRGQKDRSSYTVGQSKGAMVFHMLRKSLGDEKFLDGLRDFIRQKRFQQASWSDIRAAFEKQSDKDLTAFFNYWVDGKGLPEIRAEQASVRRKSGAYDIGIELLPKGGPAGMEVPVVVTLMNGETRAERLTLDAAKKESHITTAEEPRSLVIDRDYDVARMMTEPEIDPVIATLFADPKPLIVQPASNKQAYEKITAALRERGGREKNAADLKDSEIKTSSLAVLGFDNPLIQRLFGTAGSSTAGLSLIARRNPWNAAKVIVLVDARSAAETEAALPAISGLAQSGSLAFDGGVNVSKKTGDGQRGIEMELRQPTAAIDTSMLKPVSDMIAAAADKKIIYVGEYHDQYAHHAAQLQVIKALYEKDPKLAIGMEMFQRPFQNVVDDYISGSIDERAFLKGTEYFKRWSFDYNLYKPILDFARSVKIPVVALNLNKEITEKVSKTGLDSLTGDERSLIPGQLDFSDDEYRSRLKTVFDQHKGAGEKNFDFFYQAQILWDETMALSIDEFLRKNSDRRMVVIAGGGHLAYGSGIPKRSFRRNSLPYFIALNDGGVDRDIAHYILLPESLEGTGAPRLMAMLQAADKKVSVTGLPENSVSRKAGIREGDIILTLDGEQVTSVEDIKLALFYKQQGDELRVRVLRKRVLFGGKEMEFVIKL